MKVLVTGSTGFIGGQLCRALIAQGHIVRAFHRQTSSPRALDNLEVEHALGDLTQPVSLEAAMQGIEVVFHAAARLGYSQDPARAYAVTVEGTRSVLQAAMAAGVRRLVHTSSVAALGVPDVGGPTSVGIPTLIDENHTWNYNANWWQYGYAKYLAEMEVQKAVAQGLDVVIVNPSGVFGAGDVYRTSNSLVVQVAQGRIPVGVEGGWNVVHVDDVIDGHLAALERGRCGERYILGGQNMSFDHFLNLIAEVTGGRPPRGVLPVWLTRAMAYPLRLTQSFIRLPANHELLRMTGRYFYYDIRKAREELGLGDPKPARLAIEEAWGWFNRQRKPANKPDTPFKNVKRTS